MMPLGQVNYMMAGFDQFPNDVSGGSDNNECYMVGSDKQRLLYL
jgi:hypothetical protein